MPRLQEAKSVCQYTVRTGTVFEDSKITQTEEKLRRENISGEFPATNAHHIVGQQVRQGIQRIGGAMPETMPPEESLKLIEKRNRPARTKKLSSARSPDA